MAVFQWGEAALVAYDYEAVTVSTSAVGLTAAKYNSKTSPGKKYALIVVESNPIRWRMDGSNPSSTEGIPQVASDVVILVGASAIAKFRAIRSGAADATLRVTYAVAA